MYKHRSTEREGYKISVNVQEGTEENGDHHSLHRDYELKMISKKGVKAGAGLGFNNVHTSGKDFEGDTEEG